jgi:dimethylamine--corrinoid protein Co-methyltransferase
MGGIKTAGDLVFRMQLRYGMKIGEAKRFIAEKLGVSVFDLCDPTIMTEIRDDRGFGIQMPEATTPMGIAAKIRISDALGIKINSVEVFKRKAGITI